MRKLVLFTAFIGVGFVSSASAQLPESSSIAYRFVEFLLNEYGQTTSCRDEFDPHPAVARFEMRDGKTRKWEEMDRREPGVKNHMMSWQFPGITITSFTWFSYYGPSTWLDRLEMAEPVELGFGLDFGDSVADFSRTLEITEDFIRSRQDVVWRQVS